MSKLRVYSSRSQSMASALGPNQDLQNPLGVGGLKLRTLTQPLPKGEESLTAHEAQIKNMLRA